MLAPCGEGNWRPRPGLAALGACGSVDSDGSATPPVRSRGRGDRGGPSGRRRVCAPAGGTFGDTVRRGVEVALGEFVDLIEQGGAPHPARGETHVKLGRLEFREHRPLEALLAAYRIGARTSWRRLVAVGEEAELTAPTLYQPGDASCEYIDEISAAAAEGYADE